MRLYSVFCAERLSPTDSLLAIDHGVSPTDPATLATQSSQAVLQQRTVSLSVWRASSSSSSIASPGKLSSGMGLSLPHSTSCSWTMPFPLCSSAYLSSSSKAVSGCWQRSRYCIPLWGEPLQGTTQRTSHTDRQLSGATPPTHCLVWTNSTPFPSVYPSMVTPCKWQSFTSQTGTPSLTRSSFSEASSSTIWQSSWKTLSP